VPHEVFNLSDTEPVVAVVARSSADEWDNIVPYERLPRQSGTAAKAGDAVREARGAGESK
jgi:hypothetical protein